MKRLLLLLLLSASAFGQGYNAYQQTVFTSVTTAVPVFTNSLVVWHQLIWTVSGTMTTCTVALDTSPDGTTWTLGGAITGQTCTTAGNSAIVNSIVNYVRVNVTAISGAGATVIVTYKGFTTNPSGGGGGSGTVSPNSGTAGALGVYTAAGGSTTIGPDQALIDNGTSLLLTYSGFQIGNFNGTNGLSLNPGTSIGWCSTAVGTCTSTGIGIGPTGGTTSGVLAVGKTYLGEDGLLRLGNSCRVTADIALPVNTPQPVCSFSIPQLPNKAWAWQCVMPWVISAGTGTNTLAISVNSSNVPSVTTGGGAEIKTTNTNTATENYVNISASGTTTILTSPTITPSATVFMSSTYGTITLPNSAGTFSIQMTAAGTTVTAAVKTGATCYLY